MHGVQSVTRSFVVEDEFHCEFMGVFPNRAGALSCLLA